MSGNRLVYSSEQGRVCPECREAVARCRCRQPTVKVPTDGIVRVGRETKGRKGAGVTIITGLPLDADGVKALAKELKQRCGSGGTVRPDGLELQGDHRDLVVGFLEKKGWKVKRAGG
jgi:translation initiation factor 1